MQIVILLYKTDPKKLFIDLTVREVQPVQCMGSPWQQINMKHYQQSFRVQVREKRGLWTPGQPDI